MEPSGQTSGSSTTRQPADHHTMGAEHHIAQPPIPEQRPQLAGTSAYPERRQRFDLKEAVMRQRLHSLLGSQGRAGQDSVDRVVLQTDHQSLGLAATRR